MLKKIMIVGLLLLETIVCASSNKNTYTHCVEKVAYYAAHAVLAQDPSQKQFFESAMYKQLDACLAMQPSKNVDQKIVDPATPSYGDCVTTAENSKTVVKKLAACDTPEY